MNIATQEVIMENVYVKATKENLNKMLELGCTFGIDTEIGLLSKEYISTNKFKNMYSFSEATIKKFNLKYIEL